MPRPLAIFADPACLLHDVGGGHPERPERLVAALDVVEELQQAGLPVRNHAVADALDETLNRVHSTAYLDALRANAGGWWAIDGDTIAMPKSHAAAVRSAGCALAAVDLVCSSSSATQTSTDQAFVLSRPPGHHALADRGMGFCLLNNIAIAAKHAQQAHGVERVAIIDFDVHHGNGTEAIFAADPSVLFFSSHQANFYPGTGALHDVGHGGGEGFTVNLPLAAGAGDPQLQTCYGTLLPPILRAFSPQLILVSAGFDLHERDPLGGFAVTDDGVGNIVASLAAAADELCDGRIILLLEGGYDLTGLKGSIRQSIRALVGDREPADSGPTDHLPSVYFARAEAAVADVAARKSV